MPLVKVNDGFTMTTPCGMTVMCNSKGERQIKYKLHKKKCQVCKDAVIERTSSSTYLKFGIVIKEV